MTNFVKDLSSFPIPLGGMLRRWSMDGSLRVRLRSVIAEAVEMETGRPVLLDSLIDTEIKAALDCIFAEAAKTRRGKP